MQAQGLGPAMAHGKGPARAQGKSPKRLQGKGPTKAKVKGPTKALGQNLRPSRYTIEHMHTYVFVYAYMFGRGEWVVFDPSAESSIIYYEIVDLSTCIQ